MKHQLIPVDGNNSTFSTSTLDFFVESLICSVPPNTPLITLPEETLIEWGITGNGIRVIGNSSSESVLASCSTLEEFALQSLAPGGHISKATYSSQFNTLLLTIAGTRYCRNIGREHKSNNIYLACKLTKGIIVQRCFDPDCRHFESDPVEIPADLLEQARKHFN